MKERRMTYFSDQEAGERPQTGEAFSDAAWGGVRAEILARINDGSFGASFVPQI
jgi:hypothetical protein